MRAGLVSAVSCLHTGTGWLPGEGVEQRGTNMLPSVRVDDCTLPLAENFFRK